MIESLRSMGVTDEQMNYYSGVMGVPITFLDKYNPDQFEILGCSYSYGRPKEWNSNIDMTPIVKGKNIYKRLLVKAV